jgi:hypothetical protein
LAIIYLTDEAIMDEKPKGQAGVSTDGSQSVPNHTVDGKRDVFMVNSQDRNAANVLVFPSSARQPEREIDVERVNQYPLYELGKALRAIAGFTGDVPAHTCFLELFTADQALDNLMAGRPFPIGISRGVAQALKNDLRGVWDHYFYADKADGSGKEFKFPTADDPPVLNWRWEGIRAALGRFETVFSAEIAEATTYFVPRRGIYSTAALVDTADDSFPAELRPFIPEKALGDWRAAGRCLAFSLLSASGFHVARAVEGALEAYYQHFSGKPGQTLNSWHDYHAALVKIASTNPTPKPTEKTLTEFDQMRLDYRNPIMHPRVVLDEADARVLFNNGESLIIAMASEIRTAQQGVQTTLALVAPPSGQ